MKTLENQPSPIVMKICGVVQFGILNTAVKTVLTEKIWFGHKKFISVKIPMDFPFFFFKVSLNPQIVFPVCQNKCSNVELHDLSSDVRHKVLRHR